MAAGADASASWFTRRARASRLARAAELARRLPPFVTPVLLFWSMPPSAAAKRALAALSRTRLQWQFHGDESPPQTAMPAAYYISGRADGAGFDLLDFAARFARASRAMLLDAHVEATAAAGGKVSDWSLDSTKRAPSGRFVWRVEPAT